MSSTECSLAIRRSLQRKAKPQADRPRRGQQGALQPPDRHLTHHNNLRRCSWPVRFLHTAVLHVHTDKATRAIIRTTHIYHCIIHDAPTLAAPTFVGELGDHTSQPPLAFPSSHLYNNNEAKVDDEKTGRDES